MYESPPQFPQTAEMQVVVGGREKRTKTHFNTQPKAQNVTSTMLGHFEEVAISKYLRVLREYRSIQVGFSAELGAYAYQINPTQVDSEVGRSRTLDSTRLDLSRQLQVDFDGWIRESRQHYPGPRKGIPSVWVRNRIKDLPRVGVLGWRVSRIVKSDQVVGLTRLNGTPGPQDTGLSTLCLSCVRKTSDNTEDLMFGLIAGQPLNMSQNKALANAAFAAAMEVAPPIAHPLSDDSLETVNVSRDDPSVAGNQDSAATMLSRLKWTGDPYYLRNEESPHRVHLEDLGLDSAWNQLKLYGL
ncbi:hypothetical protein B0H14DRAFT_2650739 [Mycena olivaceomarginata]|nr:hypothetical protein B0H14DRAFT_2650739 [Mycena olivaceomarginata]